MPNKKSIGKMIIFLVPLAILYYFLKLRYYEYGSYEKLWLEDGIWEYIQFGFIIIASLIWFLISIKFLKTRNFLFGFLFLLIWLIFLFIGWEEISWWQRIFNITTPDSLIEINKQTEINIHNIGSINENIYIVYRMILIYTSIGWLILLGVKSNSKIKLWDKIRFYLDMIITPWYLIFYFVALYINFWTFGNYAPQDYEWAELLLYMWILIFMVRNYYILQLFIWEKESKITI